MDRRLKKSIWSRRVTLQHPEDGSLRICDSGEKYFVEIFRYNFYALFLFLPEFAEILRNAYIRNSVCF